MFVIQVTNLENQVSKHYWINKNNDDFIRFLPNNFGVPKENLRFWKFSDDEMPIIENLLKVQGEEFRGLDLGEDGKIKVIKIESITNEQTEVIEEVVSIIREITGVEFSYPYDNNGNFLGNGA